MSKVQLSYRLVKVLGDFKIQSEEEILFESKDRQQVEGKLFARMKNDPDGHYRIWMVACGGGVMGYHMDSTDKLAVGVDPRTLRRS